MQACKKQKFSKCVNTLLKCAENRNHFGFKYMVWFLHEILAFGAVQHCFCSQKGLDRLNNFNLLGGGGLGGGAVGVRSELGRPL